jgi:hypothetical protein
MNSINALIESLCYYAIVLTLLLLITDLLVN